MVASTSAGSGVKVRREWRAKTEQESEACVHIRHFISSLPPDNLAHPRRARYIPTLETLYRLAKAFEVNPVALLAEIEQERIDSSPEES